MTEDCETFDLFVIVVVQSENRIFDLCYAEFDYSDELT